MTSVTIILFDRPPEPPLTRTVFRFPSEFELPGFYCTINEGFVSAPHWFLSLNIINSKGWLEEFYLFYQHVYKNKLSSYKWNQQLVAWTLFSVVKEFAIKSNYCGFCQQIDVKANSDLKHVKDSLAAEKKKKKTLLKSFDDVSLWYYCNCKFIILCILQLYQKLGAASQLTFTS